jgi:hypothetical protein
MLMLMIGYSSYALIVIRSDANPPMDRTRLGYLYSGQLPQPRPYGDRPLLYGQAYTSQVALTQDGNMCKPQMKEGAPIYSRKEKASKDEKDSYFVVSTKKSMSMPRTCSSTYV